MVTRASKPKDTLRIIFWNIRAGDGKRSDGICTQLCHWQPDVIGLSEFRGTPASQQLAAQLADAGFTYQLTTVNRGKLAQNALLLASRYLLRLIHAPHMPTLPTRWILARVDAATPISVGLMHVPNYTSPTLKYPFLDAVLKMVGAWGNGPAILGGDTNCGKRGIDEAKPSPPKFHREYDFIVGMEDEGWGDTISQLSPNAKT